MWLKFVLWALLIMLVVRQVRRFVAGVQQGLGVRPKPGSTSESGVRMVRDPVCGTFVVPANAVAVRDAAGVHHFCSEKCRTMFLNRSAR